MAKKLAEWDRMMDTGKEEERAQSFDLFRKLSDEEVDLANRTVSKNRLKEFIDLKIQYFDQLASETNPKLRSEGMKKFQQVCESEMALAKAVGPQHVLLEEAEAESALAKKQKAEEQARKEEEEKKKKQMEEEKKKKEEEKKKEDEQVQKQRDVQATYGMQAMSDMMPRMMPGMRGRGMPLTMTPEQMRAMMMASSQNRMFAMQQQQRFDTPPGTHDGMGSMTEGLHFGIEQKPLTAEEFTALYNADGTLQFHKTPGRFPSRLPSKSSVADVKKEGTDKDSKAPVSDIDKKLKLLTQLESARGVLQNHYPPDSSTSMAEEVKNRLRKINRLQMKVIDEILGSKADLTSEIVSDLRPEKNEREKFDDVRKEGVSEAKKGKKGKHSKEPKKIIVELPDYSEANTHVVTASISRFDAQGVCTGTTDLCPGPEESRPEVLWERPRSETRAPDRMSMAGPPGDDYVDYGQALDIGQRCIHYEQHIDFFPDNVPHYHEEMIPPEDTYYQQAPFSTPTYSVLQSQCFAPPPCLPLEFDIVARGSLSFAREVNDVGVEAEDPIPEDDAEEELPVPPSKPKMLSQTTIIVNRPEQGVGTEIVQPLEQFPQVQQVPVQSTQPVASMPNASEAPPTQSPQIHVQAVEVKQSSSSDKRFARSCQESLQRIADSVDDILNSLSSLSSDYVQGAGRRRDRYDDDSYDDDSYDEYDDYSESDDTPPSRQRRRPKSRRRNSACNKESPSLWGWLCRSVRTIREGSPSRPNQNDSQTMQVANRIRELVQRVIQASNEVIMARKAIQQGGLQGQIAMQNVFEAENKLWQLINLESQLANELAQYRTLDTTSDKAYFDSLIQAEDKIRRLIQVETQLANEIGAWRQMSPQMPQATSYTRTTMYKVPGTAYSTSTSATPTGLLSPTSSSTGYTS